MADVTARMLALLSTLQTGRSFTGDELTRRLSVSPRTLRRDVDRLRSYGYPVETQPGPGGYYRLSAGRTMPPLVLDDDEAVATLLALAALASTTPSPTPPSPAGPTTPARPSAAGSSSGERGIDDAALRAYGKVDQFLPARLRGQVVSVRSSLETTPQPAPTVTADQLGTIAEAIAAVETISFSYINARGEHAIRRVEPYRQIHYMLRWYLLAYDLDRDDWRVFRLDRITDERRTNTPYTPRPLPADSATAYLRQALNKSKQKLTLTIDAPIAPVLDALKYQDAEIHPLDADHTSVTIALDTWQWLLLPLAFLNADFHLPPTSPFTPAYRTFAHRLLTATT
ncbi:WYL domain-containing protein [Kribbella sp. NPDC050820]|uniref:helix-turn-helix transcriptional regulator n=1 Tax=Kribbella sp. NPDC050820 TaxID=3155408 RepID=UPI0034051743